MTQSLREEIEKELNEFDYEYQYSINEHRERVEYILSIIERKEREARVEVAQTVLTTANNVASYEDGTDHSEMVDEMVTDLKRIISVNSLTPNDV